MELNMTNCGVTGCANQSTENAIRYKLVSASHLHICLKAKIITILNNNKFAILNKRHCIYYRYKLKYVLKTQNF